MLRFLVLAACAGCTGSPSAAHVGYSRLGLEGGIALTTAGGGGDVQDIGPTFGLGDDQDAPYVRLATRLAGLDLAAAGFALCESGTGTLGSTFGGIGAGATVTTDLELANVQFSAAYPFAVGTVTVAPGLAFDAFALDFRVRTDPQNREEVDEIVGVPLPFVRASAPFGDFTAMAEMGWLDAHDLTGADGRFADVTATIAWRLSGSAEFIAGWRYLAVDASGDSDDEAVAIELAVRGWFVGGGVAF